jgi:hypothetical protein
VKDGVDVDVEGAVPVLRGDFEDAAGDGAAGAVDQDVDAAQLVDGSLDRGDGVLGIGHVAADYEGLSAGQFQTRSCVADFGVFEIAADNGDVRAAPREEQRGRRADALGAAGDQADFAVQVHRASLARQCNRLKLQC